MPLTPDDVVTKQFQHVRFKEGFDPDEVDDFLDEVVVEWRKALAENEELKAKLAAYEAGGAPEAPAESAAVEAPAETVAVTPPTPAAVAPSESTAAMASIIELAQRVHDEHVAEGVAQRDKLVSEAQTQAASIIADAEARSRDELARLEQERASLENKLTELRQFERDYRSQLRSYFEKKLNELDTNTTSNSPVATS
ncbi:DivIVA domain-containing protein [Microbacterium sp. X-17]|uniref:DivIVA domain-containing protein n=1 Tax=Microbacterium sp. X-17 TaxID=3144404 RepID=UPI0031F4B637